MLIVLCEENPHPYHLITCFRLFSIICNHDIFVKLNFSTFPMLVNHKKLQKCFDI